MPPALSELRGFRGRIDYVGFRDGVAGEPAFSGTLTVGNGSWTLDERSAHYELRAGFDGASIETGGQMVAVDDVLSSDALSNAWAIAVGSIATHPIESSDGDRTWMSAGLNVFVDATGARLLGIGESGDRGIASYALDEWQRSGSLSVPGHVLRLRGGIPDAGFTITHYRVTAALPDRAAIDAAAPAGASEARRPTDAIVLFDASLGRQAWGEARAVALACLLVLIVFVVAWTRREAFLDTLCQKMARDPRGWRRAGVSVFVEPDGALILDGLKYRVGPHFYGRAALVQCSALFVRVTAPGVPRVVILPRKFRPIDLGIKAREQRRASPGFTLVETLLATALFAAIVLLAIYPAVTAVARASALAAERSKAVVLASNALADEEAVNDYDGGAPQGSATSTLDGLTLTVSVSAGPMRGVSDLDVSVADANGNVLAHLTSWLGAPVKSPPNSGGGPPGG